ncbi:MAG: DUF4912 domain-containing protein [Candidatus Omnitrophota bacterium]|nr:DUF4912 domain-containing protein [Candidatus Omnitrophota bacterium]
MKKAKVKKREPIERVYRDGKEAIVKETRKRPALHSGKTPLAATAPVQTGAVNTCVIQEQKPQTKTISVSEYDLPSYNAVSRITLIAKDPFWIYAYWEIAESSVEDVKRQLGGNLDGTRFVVRMYDVTYKDFNGFNANHWFDIEVGRHSSNWYISLWNDNVSYCGEIGILHHSGRFFPMARSNFVHTPRSSSSNRFEEIWMDLAEELKDQPATATAGRPAVEYDTAGRFSYQSISRKRRIYLTEADLRAYYFRLSPLLREIMFSRISRKRFYRYMYSRMRGREWRDTLYFRRLHGAKFGRKMLLGASEFMFLGGSENMPQGASEFVQPGKKRKFFFEIGAELIVYGRTESDAEVKLGDKKVDLRPDGTFSMRLALPDGKIPLPFTAMSKDKIETRKIETTVERKTVSK